MARNLSHIRDPFYGFVLQDPIDLQELRGEPENTRSKLNRGFVVDFEQYAEENRLSREIGEYMLSRFVLEVTETLEDVLEIRTVPLSDVKDDIQAAHDTAAEKAKKRTNAEGGMPEWDWDRRDAGTTSDPASPKSPRRSLLKAFENLFRSGR